MAEEDDALAAAQGLHEDGQDSNDISTEDAGKGSSLRAQAEDVRASMGDAEDASVGFLEELVGDIFAEMRVKDENEKAVRAAVSIAWRQALDGCILAAADGRETMDAGAVESNSHCKWRQHVRPRIQGDSESAVAVQTQARRPNRPEMPVVEFLSRLWTLFDTRLPFVETQLARYPTSTFRVSSLPTPGHKGDWEIPVDDLGDFLRCCIRAARLSALTSAVDAVIHVNATLLAKKRYARANLQLYHITMCVQAALLAAEEAEAAQEGPPDQKPHVFQTELDTELPPAEDRWLVYYSDDPGDRPTPSIDRNATGSVVSKREVSSEIAKKQKLARNVVFSLFQQQRRDSSDSKWGALRKRVLVQQEQHVGIAVEADMALVMIDAAKVSPSKKKASTVAIAASTDTMTARLSPHKTSSDPDTAALSNIFSLGTPRQLSGEELARRNDILSVLEREEAKVSRRMAVASIAAATVPLQCVGPDGKPIVSETDKAFQEYVAVNSTITVTNGSCQVPSHHGDDLSPSKKASKQPSQSKRTNHGAGGDGRNGRRTKFDLALDPPRFDVVEGNSHYRMAAEAAAAAAMAAVGRKPKSRGGAFAKAAVSPLLHAPSPPTSPSIRPPQPPPQSHHGQHLRPLETASGQLPQLDTSRLAVGVKAVVRGVEKRGPRHDPSRNARLRLHNYVSSADDEPDEAAVVSPLKPPSGGNAGGGLNGVAHLPPVSPIKASPHRKHVTFPPPPVAASKPAVDLSPQRPPPPKLASPVPPNGSRRFPAKQPTYEKRTSPPRVRNRHLAESSNNASKSKRKHLVRQTWGMNDEADDSHALRAPRRGLAFNESMDDDDE